MRIAYRVMMLTATVVAASAFMAATASAQVEVVDEATGAHCDPACDLHIQGETTFTYHIFGLESRFSDCVVELDATVGSTGEGQVGSVALSNHAGSTSCTVAACSLPWPAHFREPAPGEEALHTEVCVNEGGTLRSCEVAFPFAEEAPHDYESTFADLRGVNHANFPNCEFGGELHIEGTPVELVH